MSYISISKLTEQKITNLYNLHGAFFAFSDSQYNAKAKDGIQYTNNNGLFVPKESTKDFYTQYDSLMSEAYKYQVDNSSVYGICSHEFFNHEMQISGEGWEELKSILSVYIRLFPELFTDDVIQTSYNKAYNYAIEHDLF